MNCKEFWVDTGKRCAWTFAQALLGSIAVGQTVTEIPWKHALSIALVATIACFLKQIMVFTEEDKTGIITAKQMKQLRDYQGDTVEEPEDAEVFEEVDADGDE